MFLNFKKLLFLFVLNLVVMYGSDESKPSIISMITASILCPWIYSDDTNITYRLCANPSQAEIDYAKEQFCSMVQKKINLGSDEANIKHFFEIGKVRSYFSLSKQLCILLGVAKKGEFCFGEFYDCNRELGKGIISQYQLNLMDSKLTFFGPLTQRERELWIIFDYVLNCSAFAVDCPLLKIKKEYTLFLDIFIKLCTEFYNINDCIRKKQVYGLKCQKDCSLNNLFNSYFSAEIKDEENFQKLKDYITWIYNCDENSEDIGDDDNLVKSIQNLKNYINYFIDNKSIRNLYSAFYNSEFNGWVEEKTNVTRVVFIIAAAVLWCFIIYSIYLKWKISVK